MSPELILETIKAGFEFGTELLRFWQTPLGEQAFEKMLKDREAWDKFWAQASGGLKDFLSGRWAQ